MISVETKEFIRQEIREELNERDHELTIRLVRIEEELKHQRELIQMNLDNSNKRFEAIDKRFEAIDKRFEAIDKRFEAIDKRFESMTRLMGLGFVVLATLITVFKFVN